MQQHERLKTARTEAGYRSGTEAAKAMGVTVATYNSHENGHRGLTIKAAEVYAEQFGVRLAWLLTGEEPKHYASIAQLKREFEASDDADEWGTFKLDRSYRGSSHGVVAEIDPTNGSPVTGEYGVLAEWGIPGDFVEKELRAEKGKIFLVAIADNLLSPAIKSGDRAIVAAGSEYRGDGLYVIEDSDLVLYVRHVSKSLSKASAAGALSISTHNPPYTDTVSSGDLKIAGKVIGSIGKI